MQRDLHLDGNRALHFCGKQVRLSPTSARLLRRIAGANGGCVTHAQLLAELALQDSVVSTLHVQIAFLRAALRKIGLRHAITTVHGEGYRFNPAFRLTTPERAITVPIPDKTYRRLCEVADFHPHGFSGVMADAMAHAAQELRCRVGASE